MQETRPLSDVLTAEDWEFLTSLANELKTQDTAFTAKPVIFQILERTQDVGMDPDYADGMALGLGEDCTLFLEKDLAEARAWLREGFEWTPEEIAEIDTASCLKDLAVFSDEHEVAYHFTGYRDAEQFKGFFLTRRALSEHVERNAHHYSNPVSYAQAAGWRNPELERLLGIIEKFATTASELSS